MDGMTGMCKIENYRGGRHGGTNRNYNNIARDCGVVDPCSPFYRSYLRAVRWVAEQCEQFLDDQQNYSIDKIIKDIMTAQLVPNNDDYVVLGPKLDRPMSPGIWLEEKTARLVRELQRDYNSHNPSKYFGEFKTPCGRTMEQIRSQFYIDCFSECIQPQSSRGMKANTTECVPVPSSEHVAEIVGKKGGKIKNIRAETNTYIKTPKRDEEPVFVITGRKEDVAFAKQKILAAAEHFSQLREARRQNPGGPAPAVGPPKREGDVTVSVEVPYEFVGLVVGQKGATIKRIQQDTSTYITTPSRRHRPIFEVVGQPADVELARQAIQMHINSRVEKFRGDSASSAGDSFRPTSSMSFAGIDDSVFGAPPPAAGDLFGSLSNANLGGTWTGVPPPPLPQYAPPPPTPCPQYGGGRLSAFRNIGVEGLESLSATLMDLALSEPTDAACWLDGRGRTASLPAADPADPPFGRRGSDELPAFGGVLFGRAGALGWDAPALTMPRRASKGSSETLNSDSGIETTTPPPLDGLLFGPIGSKRTSPTALLLAD